MCSNWCIENKQKWGEKAANNTHMIPEAKVIDKICNGSREYCAILYFLQLCVGI